MKAVLLGGPADGEVFEIPTGLEIFRYSVPVPTSKGSLVSNLDYEPKETQRKIADYRHSGQAFIGLNGVVREVIYKFERWE